MNQAITKPGVYRGMPMADYLGIPAFHSGMIETILSRCVRAAWHESHLNPNRPEREEGEPMDTGTVLHSMVNEGGMGAIQVIDANLYPTKTSGNIPDSLKGNNAIKAAAAEARAAGKIPILKTRMEVFETAHRAALDFIVSTQSSAPDVFRAFQHINGESELTIVWEDGDVLCKARFDRITNDRLFYISYKTTKGNVEPDAWGRNAMLDYYAAEAFYMRGAYEMFGKEPDMAFLCQETTEPFLCSLIGMDPKWKDVGNQRAKLALRQWQAAVATGRFPGYPTRIAFPEMPPWEEARMVEKQLTTGIDYGSQA